MKKNRFFVFCFSFIPGAGQMYLGMMKKGLTLMSMFIAVLFFSWILYFDAMLVLLLPVFFYSFFDAHNWKRAGEEECREEDQRFILSLTGAVQGVRPARYVGSRAVGVLCILTGLFLIYERVFMTVIDRICGQWGLWYLYDIARNVPLLIVAIIIILFGAHLFKNSVMPSGKGMEFIEYKGEDEENDGEKE